MSNASRTGVLILHFVASLLLGVALAGPVRLSFYFYTKPFWDLLIDGFLVIAAVTLALRWLGPKGASLILLIPLLVLCWIRIEFILFSKAEIYSVFSYLFIALWGACFAAVWKFFDKEEGKPKKVLRSMTAIAAGLALGFMGWSSVITLVISIAFIAALCLGNSEIFKGQSRAVLRSLGLMLIPVIFLVNLLLPSPSFYKSQSKFHDKVVFSQATAFQQIDITEWKGNHWFYQDGINLFSSIDSWLYFEPFAHPAMQLLQPGSKVLIVGGENGMLARELLKYKNAQIDLAPVDKAYQDLSENLSFFTEQHRDVFSESRLTVLDESAFRLLNKSTEAYDAIFVDVPDPIDIELNQYFSKEFYGLCHAALKANGLLVTQSGSPYFATTAFQSIQKTIQVAGFDVQAYHNQVLSLGEWAWTIGAKEVSGIELKSSLKELNFDGVETQWLNNEAMQMMLSFGKSYVTTGDIKVNTIEEPVIYKYYNQGNYQLQ
ncbi:MAG: hypothetical protein Roseis2KO_18720 [Roseivirga sp.]